jgi:hypothetical protein
VKKVRGKWQNSPFFYFSLGDNYRAKWGICQTRKKDAMRKQIYLA